MKITMAQKIICMVVVVCFSFNIVTTDCALALDPGKISPGGLRPAEGAAAVQDAMLSLGSQKLTLKNINREELVNAINSHRPMQFTGGTQIPDNVKFGAADYDNLPDNWVKDPTFYQNTDFIQAFKDFTQTEAGAVYKDIAIGEEDYTAKDINTIPIYRPMPKDRFEKGILFHKGFLKKWNDIKKNDIWFTYEFPNGRKVSVSLAWYIFYRVTLKDKPDLTGDAIWMWFLASYCTGGEVVYNNNAFKDQALFFLALYKGEDDTEFNRWATEHRLPDEFASRNDAAAREEAVNLALAINQQYYYRGNKSQDLPPMGGGMDVRGLTLFAESNAGTPEALVEYIIHAGLYLQIDIVKGVLKTDPKKLAEFEKLLVEKIGGEGISHKLNIAIRNKNWDEVHYLFRLLISVKGKNAPYFIKIVFEKTLKKERFDTVRSITDLLMSVADESVVMPVITHAIGMAVDKKSSRTARFFTKKLVSVAGKDAIPALKNVLKDAADKRAWSIVEILAEELTELSRKFDQSANPPMGGGMNEKDVRNLARAVPVETIVNYIIETGLYAQISIVREELKADPEKLAAFEKLLRKKINITNLVYAIEKAAEYMESNTTQCLAEKLVSIASKEDIAALTSALKIVAEKSVFDTTKFLAEKLILLAGRKAVPALANAIEKADKNRRWYTSEFLIHNKSWYTTEFLAEKLVSIADKSDMAALARALNKTAKIGEWAATRSLAEKLMSIGGRKSTPALMRAINEAVQNGAQGTTRLLAEKLISVAGREAIPALANVIEEAAKKRLWNLIEFLAEKLVSMADKDDIPVLTSALKKAYDEAFRVEDLRRMNTLYKKLAELSGESDQGAKPPMGGGMNEKDVRNLARTATAERLVEEIVNTGLYAQINIIREELQVNSEKLAAFEKLLAEKTRHPLEIAIDELAVPVAYEKGPGIVKMAAGELENIYKSINLLHQTRIEIFVPKGIGISDTMKKAISDINLKHKNADKDAKDIIICRSPYEDEDHLERLLSIAPESGVKRIVVTADGLHDAEKLVAMKDLFKDARLLNVALPDDYADMKPNDKTFYQAWVLNAAILGRMIERDSGLPLKAALANLLEGSIEGDVNEFIDNLAKPDSEWANPADRIGWFLGKMVRLSRKIVEEYELLKLRMKAFWTAA